MPNVFPTTSLNAALRMHESSDSPDYWFYHKASFPADFPAYYKHLVDNAASYIEIWDPYFNVSPGNSDQDVFANINNNITIKILTMKGLSPTNPYLPMVENAMKTLIPANKNVRFGLRVVNRGDEANHGGRFFHDRFLIIDEHSVFLVGASVGFHVRSEMSTGILKITNADTSQFIKSLFNYYWTASSQHEIPLKFLHA